MAIQPRTIRNSTGFSKDYPVPAVNPLKLHISIPMHCFKRKKEIIDKILTDALENDEILQFTRFSDDYNILDDITRVQERRKERSFLDFQGKKQDRLSISSKLHHANMPYTVCLKPNIDCQKILSIAKKLEFSLISMPPCQKNFLPKGALAVTPHITLRVDTIDGKYISMSNPTRRQVNQMVRATKKSELYTFLRNWDISHSLQLLKNKFKQIISNSHSTIMEEISNQITRIEKKTYSNNKVNKLYASTFEIHELNKTEDIPKLLSDTESNIYRSLNFNRKWLHREKTKALAEIEASVAKINM